MTDPLPLQPLLLQGLDKTWNRLWVRLDGLSQLEYRWAPVAGCWDVYQDASGWRVDYVHDAPDPTPVTTIAWRTWHIAVQCLANYIAPALGDWPLQATGQRWYCDVQPALAELATSYQVFRERIASLGEDGLRQQLGEDWGPHAELSWADLGIHALDELSHHAAEIALLRDLYRESDQKVAR